MKTLAKINIEEFVDNYPRQKSISDFTTKDLEKYLSEILDVANEFGSVKKFPGGVEGFVIFLMLANTTRVSAQENDFFELTFEDLNIYKYSFQALYGAVEDRFAKIFKG